MSRNNVYINEVRSTTVSANRDGYFGSDYIEIYNDSYKDISLEGWFLSDDETKLQKSCLSDVTVPAKSYAVIYADGAGDSENTVNFNISSTGEKIFLSNPEEIIVDSVNVPELGHGEVYSRVTDGAESWAIMEESMLADNSQAEILSQCTLKSPKFSHKSGFYKDSFVLELQCEPGETIYYTLDGSLPTKDSKIYEDGIMIQDISAQPNVCTSVKTVVEQWMDYEPSTEPVDKAMVVRAVAMNDKGYTSDVVTHTYFVNQGKYEEKNIVSVVGDYADFFGDDGIFVTGKAYDEWYLSGMQGEEVPSNFTQSGRRWEVLGNVQFLKSGEEITNQLAGIRTYGGSSRQGKVKRLSLFARDIYSGSDYFEGFNLDGKEVHSMGTNSGATKVAFPDLAKDRDVATQNFEDAIVFLNGEF